MHKIAMIALEEHHAKEAKDKAFSDATKLQLRESIYETQKQNLRVFLTRYGYEEPEGNEVLIDTRDAFTYTLTGNPREISADYESALGLLIRKCSFCGYEESRWVKTIEDLGREMEHWVASEFHTEGRCEELVKLLVEVQTRVWDCR